MSLCVLCLVFGDLQEVIREHGPPDATVVVSTANHTELDDDTVNDVLTSLGEAGEIILVR